MPDEILTERDGAVATVTLNRPHRLNVLTRTMWSALGEAMRALSEDDSVRCVVLRGAGERAFSAGNDVAQFETERFDKVQATEYGHTMHAAARAIGHCRHPVLARIHGVCVGAGLSIAALADIRICGESSRFGAPIKNLGLVMAYPEIEPLARLVGTASTLSILLEGRILDAAEARQIGLVTRVVPDAQVADETRATVQRIIEGAPLVARWHKRFVRRLADPRPIEPYEYDESFDCYDTEDFEIGYHAFLAKTRPRFTGR